MSSSQSGKKRVKKSGAQNREVKKKQKKVEEQLLSFLKNYLSKEGTTAGMI